MNTKIVFIIMTTAILAYSSGLFLEALAFGEDSKLYRFANHGSFDSDWIPFFIDGDMAKIENLKSIAAFETFNSNHLVQYGELSGTSSSTVPIGSASVAFGIGIIPIQVYDEPSLQNVVDQCYFHSKDSFTPLCVVCEVLDKFGKVVGKGKIDTDTPYKASDTIPIPISPVPTPEKPTDERANDVQKVEGVRLTICGEDCIPTFMDFTKLPHGSREIAIDTALAPFGISVSAVANSGGQNEVIIFDGDTPGGSTDTNAQPDPDLRADGNQGDANLLDGICPNCAGKHMLIIAENLVDTKTPIGLIDTPDDSANGGTISIHMSKPYYLKSFVLVDHENDPTATAKAYADDAKTILIKSVVLPITGDGKVATVVMDAANVKRLDITYKDSGGITNIDLRCAPPGQGCTPGFWKQSQHFSFWKDYTPSQKFSNVFGRTITISSGSDPTLLKALEAQGGCVNALARHTVAALLNAAKIGTPSFPYTKSQVISQFQVAYDSGSCSIMEAQTDKFVLANEQECPFGNDKPCKGLKSLKLKYTGYKSPVKIEVSTGGSTFKTFYSISNNGEFTITPQSGKTMLPSYIELKITKDGKFIDKIKIDTSCLKPIDVGSVYSGSSGSKFTVTALEKVF
jgi:hypothetical protein